MEPEQTQKSTRYSPSTKIKFNVSDWKIKVRERRNNRMRLQINLNKDEALGYRNFADICKPEDITDSDFMKTVFLTGIEAMNQQLADLVKKYAVENREDLASSGITVIEGEDGDIQLAESSISDILEDGRESDKDLSGAPAIQEGVLHDQEIKKYIEEE